MYSTLCNKELCKEEYISVYWWYLMFSFNMVGPTALVYVFSERLEWFKTLLSSIYSKLNNVTL